MGMELMHFISLLDLGFHMSGVKIKTKIPSWSLKTYGEIAFYTLVYTYMVTSGRFSPPPLSK